MRREASWWCVVTGRDAEVTNAGAPWSGPVEGEAQACLEDGLAMGLARGLKRPSEGVSGVKPKAPPAASARART